MIFRISKSEACAKRVDYLKRGFIFYMCASCMLLVQFVLYLVNSNYFEYLNISGGFYYLLAALGQAFLFTLIPWVIFYLPFTFWRRVQKVGTVLFVTAINFISMVSCWISLLVGEAVRYSCLITRWYYMRY